MTAERRLAFARTVLCALLALFCLAGAGFLLWPLVALPWPEKVFYGIFLAFLCLCSWALGVAAECGL